MADMRSATTKGTTLMAISLSPLLGESGMGRVAAAASVALDRDPSDLSANSSSDSPRDDRFRALVTQSAQIIWTTDAAGMAVGSSPSWQAFTGQSVLQRSGLGWLDAVHPDDRSRVESLWRDAVARWRVYYDEYRLRRNDGAYAWMAARAVPIRGDDGTVREWIGAHVDIAGRKRVEALHDGQLRVLEMIARGAPLLDVLAAVCKVIEEQESGIICSILVLDERGRHTGTGVGPSLPAEFVQALGGINIGSPYTGSCCKALDCGQEVVVSDIAHDSRWAPVWRDLNLLHGLRAVRSIPIVASNGAVLASVAIFRREAGEPGPEDRQLLTVATHLAGIAIERARDAQSLRASEQRYRTLFESIDEGFCVIEKISGADAIDFRVVAANPAVSTQIGIDFIVGKTLRELVPAEAQSLIRRYEHVLETGESQRFERRLEALGVVLELYAFPVGDQDHRSVGVIFTDITQRKASEARERTLLAEAATANAQFRALFEQGALFAGTLSVDGTLIEPNRLSLEACGYTRAEVVGKPFWETAWWNRSPILMQRIRAACEQAAAGSTFRADLPYFLSDGTERIVDLIVLPVKDDTGRVTFLAPTGTDITEQKRAEQKLAEAHEFLHSSIDALSSHIAVLDENGVILAVNDAWRRFADENQYRGHNYGIGASYIDACANEESRCGDGDSVVSGLKDVLNGRSETFELEYPCHSPTEQRWFVMRVTRFKSPEPVRVVVSHENVTERRLAEDALKEASRRKDEFLATLAHELRNPLAPLRNGLEVMKLAANDASAVEKSRAMMERQLAQMVRLIDDLLDVSRISRGLIKLNKRRVALSGVVQQAVETSRPLIDGNEHELIVRVPSEPIFVVAEVTRLAQVFSNLLNNAAKYTERRGRIALAVERQGDQALVRVRDNGIGIASSMLPKLFEMFTQDEDAQERSQGGLGIGLSLVKRLVEMHGGTVSAHSEGPGMGSEFIVRLPIAVAGPATASARPNSASLVKAAGRRILVVDDNRDAAFSLSMMLDLMGNETRVAYDGLEALDVAATFRPDVIVLDIGMPKLNGYDAARRVREAPWGRDVALIALTGWGQIEDRRRSRSAGFDAHLTKPIDPQALEKLLAELPA